MEGDPLRGLLPGDQGVGLVGQGEDQIGLCITGAFVGIDHGNAVEQVTGVDHQGGQGGGQQAGAPGQQAHGHILHGTGIDEQAHGHGPQAAVAALVHNDAEAKAQEHIAGHDRDRVQKGPAQGGSFHVYHLSFSGILGLDTDKLYGKTVFLSMRWTGRRLFWTR